MEVSQFDYVDERKYGSCMNFGKVIIENAFESMLYKIFCIIPHTICHIWDVDEEEVDVNKVFIGSEIFKRLFILEMEGIHEHLLTNSMVT